MGFGSSHRQLPVKYKCRAWDDAIDNVGPRDTSTLPENGTHHCLRIFNPHISIMLIFRVTALGAVVASAFELQTTYDSSNFFDEFEFRDASAARKTTQINRR